MYYNQDSNQQIKYVYKNSFVHEIEHKKEMREIAESAIRETVPKMMQDYFTKSLNDLMGAIKYDVDSVLEISFGDMNNMFHDKRTKQYISNEICKAMQKNINNLSNLNNLNLTCKIK